MRNIAAPILCLLCAAACANETSGADASHVASLESTPSAQACTIAPAPDSQLPRGSLQGEPASKIKQGVDELLAAQTPPVSPGQTYVIPELWCHGGGNPFPSSTITGPSCSFQIQIDGAPAIKVSAGDPGPYGALLYNALWMSGVEFCSDPKAGTRIELADVVLSAESLEYTDIASYQLYSAQQNFRVRGPDAKSVVDAFAAAGLSDCDEIYKVFLICNTTPGVPDCGFQRLPLQQVDDAIVFNRCFLGSGPPMAGGDLTAEGSLALWNAILSAANNANFVSGSGPVDVEHTNLINARWFSWNGDELAMLLQLGNVPVAAAATATRAPAPASP